MPKKLSLAVLISGNGSNLQALIDACAKEDFPASIAVVLSNKADAYGLTRAKNARLPTHVLNHQDFSDRARFDHAMHKILCDYGVELVCLAGFMRLVSPEFVSLWHNKLINIHPSLLPAFKGLHAQKQALEAGVKIAGCTVHFVRPAMDSGPVILQGIVPVYSADTESTLTDRILKVEHQIYPHAIRWIAEGKVLIENERVWIKETEERVLFTAC